MRNVDIHQIESLLLILSLTGIASRKIRTAIYGRTVSVVAKDFARSFYSSKAWQDCRNESLWITSVNAGLGCGIVC